MWIILMQFNNIIKGQILDISKFHFYLEIVNFFQNFNYFYNLLESEGLKTNTYFYFRFFKHTFMKIKSILIPL